MHLIRLETRVIAFPDRVRGCLAFGAAGDALGAQVEFLNWPQIEKAYGPKGIGEMPARAWFTDDTQMAFFTIEGLIRSSEQKRATGRSDLVEVVLGSYWRWWWTQVGPSYGGLERPARVVLDGWMVYEPELNQMRAPGNSCMTALASGKLGTIEDKINDSKGCGAVMRAAPVGLAYHDRPLDEVYRISARLGALTHGHPDGWRPAGAFAVMIAALVGGASLADAARLGIESTEGNTRSLLERAVDIAGSREVDCAAIEDFLGGGWVGDEALAIAVACALGWAQDPAEAVRAAVNHSGDSDSTGAICGNLLGARYGLGCVPAQWLLAMQERELAQTVADDFILAFTDPPAHDQDWPQRYPGH